MLIPSWALCFFFFLKINDTWNYIYKLNFLQRKLQVCSDCKKFYFYYQKGFTEQGVSIQLV
jgi:hypothetical protein